MAGSVPRERGTGIVAYCTLFEGLEAEYDRRPGKAGTPGTTKSPQQPLALSAFRCALGSGTDASQRLSSTLTEELRFLKALQSGPLTQASQDFCPVLRHAIQDLLELRFREKEIRVEINGCPMKESCCASLVFTFEPYTMEVILQNILSNTMHYGDFIQIKAAEHNGRVRVEIRDNGLGIDMEEIKTQCSESG